MLLAQLDYIYFFFGLVLFLLGSVCISMSRAGSLRTPWWLLGAFAFVHGAAEWLNLLALTGGDSGSFRVVRSVVIGVSFLLLLEFARRTSQVLRGSTPGTWIYLPLAAVEVGLAIGVGPSFVDSSARLLIGAPAAFWTASLFFTAAARNEELEEGPHPAAPASGAASTSSRSGWRPGCSSRRHRSFRRAGRAPRRSLPGRESRSSW